MKIFDFVIVKLTICLVIGILLSHFFNISFKISVVIFAIFFGLLTAAYVISKPLYTGHIWFGIITFISTISLGVFIENLHNETHFKNHYTSNNTYTSGANSLITIKISKLLKANSYNDRYEVRILKTGSTNVCGLALLNLKKDSLNRSLNVDDVLLLKTKLLPIKNSLNPGQFNYKAYLENKHIYSQIYSKYEHVFKVKNTRHSLFGFADVIRLKINKALKKYPFNPNELAIINALLLGQRQEITKDIYEDYKHSGAIHILAVSGLHVGIILLFLNALFKPIEYLKHGRVYKILLIIICLWSFAVIAGLSASVTRATLMFSLVAIAINYKRPVNTLNVLACSAFILLLFNPNILFDVGFQLSYLAVIAIVTIYPLLYRFWHPKYWVVDKLWQAFIVSIAAQFGVLPISLFYFHQFPGLFLLSNVIVIPILGFILGYGIFVIILALINFLPNYIAVFYGKIISWMNGFFRWVSQQEAFLIKDISFNIFQVLASYLLIISLYHFYKVRNYKNTLFLLLGILVFQTSFLITKYRSQSNHDFIVFHKNRYSVLGLHQGKTLHLYHNLDSIQRAKETMINNYATTFAVSNIRVDSLKNIYPLNNQLLFVIDSLGAYRVTRFKSHIILLRSSPRVNLLRVIDSLKPELIIADGSNYKSYINRWKETCQKLKIPFHQTNKKGAFLYPLK